MLGAKTNGLWHTHLFRRLCTTRILFFSVPILREKGVEHWCQDQRGICGMPRSCENSRHAAPACTRSVFMPHRHGSNPAQPQPPCRAHIELSSGALLEGAIEPLWRPPTVELRSSSSSAIEVAVTSMVFGPVDNTIVTHLP